MLNKLKNYIRNKLGKFLGIDDLINLFDKHIDNNNSNFCDIERDFNLIKKSIDVLHNTMEMGEQSAGSQCEAKFKGNCEECWNEPMEV